MSGSNRLCVSVGWSGRGLGGSWEGSRSRNFRLQNLAAYNSMTASLFTKALCAQNTLTRDLWSSFSHFSVSIFGISACFLCMVFHQSLFSFWERSEVFYASRIESNKRWALGNFGQLLYEGGVALEREYLSLHQYGIWNIMPSFLV